ncbi:hypothetical protein B0H19DRAFT_1164989 [Mycena capillaripes]|nr:hypothetical protein B0H19DRAFT_1164989 [Mycena capillaripes]
MPPSSPSFAPSFRIIVVPPAEDQEPDYLVFDAHDLPEPDLATQPDFVSLDDALARIRPRDTPPAFDRAAVDSVIMPRRSEPPPQPDLADETVRDDSEIVEVVKVRRAFSEDGPPPAQAPPPKPKSLRSRAGSAFRSIKNLARVASRSRSNSSSSSSRPYAQEVFASSQSTQATFATAPPLPTPPPMTRRGSIVLTQLFRSPSPVDTPPSTLDFLASEPYSDDEDDDPDDDDDRQSIARRAPSPTPSARTFSSTMRRRLSILSFGKPSTASPRPPSPPTLSRGSTVPSTSSLPQTPTEETYPRPPPNTKDADDDPDRTIGEMRLDSLHFESISFDADNF